MDRKNVQPIYRQRISALLAVFILALTMGCATATDKTAAESAAASKSEAAAYQPQEIAAQASCGKCGMYPAQFPRWHSQVIFKDGTMTPFDGCKCMFNFLFGVKKFDPKHSRTDVAAAWVKDFNSGTWLNAEDAHYVVGSSMMGPMGKELIPFADRAKAMQFHQEQGGTVMGYGDINPDVLKNLGMGGMKKHMRM